jgi:hypothetical protein
MASPLEQFISQVNKLGLARTNLFDVEIGTPSCIRASGPSIPRLVNLFCQSANFPPTNIGVRELRIAGPSYKRPYNIDYGGEGISLTFLVDRNMDVKGYFDLWMANIIDPYEFNAFYNEKETQYTTDIYIRQLTETTPRIAEYEFIQDTVDIKDKYYVKLEDAFPRNIGMIELDSSAQNSVHKLTVNFAYRKVLFYNNIYSRQKVRKTVPV